MTGRPFLKEPLQPDVSEIPVLLLFQLLLLTILSLELVGLSARPLLPSQLVVPMLHSLLISMLKSPVMPELLLLPAPPELKLSPLRLTHLLPV